MNFILDFWVYPALGVVAFVNAIYIIAWIMEEPRKPRSRIDWENVYAMERDVWGQTFEHAGAPAVQRPHIVNTSPTGISTHYGPLASFNIETRANLERAAEYLTRNEMRERDKENAYMTNDEVEEVFRRGY